MCPNRKFSEPAGFSMMELLISLTTMTIIAGAAFALVGSSLRFAHATYHMTEAEQALRAANEVINRDLTTAGDGLRGVGTIRVPTAFVSNYLTLTPDLTDPGYVNLALVVSDYNVPANTAVLQSNPAVNCQAGSDRLTILTRDTSFQSVSLLDGKITQSGSATNIVVSATDLPRFQVGEIYAVTAGETLAFGVITSISPSSNTLVMTNGDPYSINQTGSGTPITIVATIVSGVSTLPVSIVRMQVIHYYVNANNLLVRRVFGVKGASHVDTVIAEHVTNLKFRYTLSTRDANDFVTQPATQLTPTTQTDLREVETTLAVETVRAVNRVTNSNSNSTICGANPNGKQVICSTTMTSIRNLQFRRAL